MSIFLDDLKVCWINWTNRTSTGARTNASRPTSCPVPRKVQSSAMRIRWQGKPISEGRKGRQYSIEQSVLTGSYYPLGFAAMLNPAITIEEVRAMAHGLWANSYSSETWQDWDLRSVVRALSAACYPFETCSSLHCGRTDHSALCLLQFFTRRGLAGLVSDCSRCRGFANWESLLLVEGQF